MVLPPPNVTGSLHVGHALTATLQDALARFHRMEGRRVLWVPGLDHAGIATQHVVEQRLARRGLHRADLGRDAFVREVWNWKEEHGGRIGEQHRRLGASLDWGREVFTLDEERGEAVTEAFVRLFDDGLIYRRRRLVNWCPHLRTAVSDIEVEHADVPARGALRLPGRERPVEFGVIHNFFYRLDGGAPGEGLEVSTTRPETMPGDVAVAVHPDDPRHAPLIGRMVAEPVTGRLVPVVADAELVDPEMGTGAVKVTPAHDPNDYECGRRHGLDKIGVIGTDGAMTAEAGPWLEGEDRFRARELIVERMQERGLYRGARDHPMRIGVCSRSGDVLEPLLLPQWYVDVRPLAAEALRQSRSGQLRVMPPQHEQTWEAWLGGIRHWCVSRQLWWGHRIPAYRVSAPSLGPPPDGVERWVAGRTEAEARAKAAERFGVPGGEELRLERDEDVLDTWFSSGLFPLAALGWPRDSRPGGGFYPLSLMETGADILFFWVARMTMLCTYLHPDRTPPFGSVYLHPMVRDAQGRKMSKSRGNVVDPLEVADGSSLDALRERVRASGLPADEVRRSLDALAREMPNGIEACGADALRLSLASYMTQGRSINLDMQRVAGWRHFCNKLWQAARFVLSRLDEGGGPVAPPRNLTLADRWMAGRVAAAAAAARGGLGAEPAFGAVAQAAHDLLQRDFCDVYIEHAKQHLASDDAAVRDNTRSVLVHALEAVLRIVHPLAPFVSEEVWQHVRVRMPGGMPASVSERPFPGGEGWVVACERSEAEMRAVLGVLAAFRSLKSNYAAQLLGGGGGGEPDVAVSVVSSGDAPAGLVAETLRAHANVLRFHCRTGRLSVDEGADGMAGRLSVAVAPAAVDALARGAVVAVSAPVTDAGALRQDLAKQRKRLAKCEKQAASLAQARGKPDYAARVPADVQERQRARTEQLAADASSLRGTIAELEKLL